MNDTSAGKTAIITGSNSGIGLGIAHALAAAGHNVVINSFTDRDEDHALARKLGEEHGVSVVYIAADMSQAGHCRELIAATVKQFGSVDILVNNAGHGDYASIAETTEGQFDRLVNVHFKGVFFLTQTLLPLIADGGGIVNTSTGLTRFAYPGYAAYAAVKGAVEVLTVYLAKELGARGITVNTVAPGAIETDFGGGAVRDNPEINRSLASITALGRVGVPDDIGPMIASLLSPDNRWVNAQRIEVSGGQAI